MEVTQLRLITLVEFIEVGFGRLNLRLSKGLRNF